MATMGLVSLPGMFTGQILGGASPVVAARYQIAIMIAIFVCISVGTIGALLSSSVKALDRFGRVKPGILRRG